MKIPERPPRIEMTEELLKLLQNREVSELLRKINDDYLSWEEIKRHSPLPAGIDAKKLWTLVRMSRGHMSDITLGRYWFFFNLYTSSNMQQKLHEIDLNSGGLPVTGLKISNEDKRMYVISSMMEEAIASSQLEGAATTRKVAKEMLRTGRKPRNVAEKMILNNYNSMNNLSSMTEKPLTIELIREIQSTITKDTLEKKEWEGKFRDHDELRVHWNPTGEILHTPPQHEEIEELLKKYCEFANSNDARYIHPVVKAAILHFLMGYIHPFEDGNGRTARTITYWYLLRNRYWIIKFMTISRVINHAKTKYAQAYLNSETDDNDITYFIKFQIDAIDQALKDLRDYIKRKLEEKKDMYRFLKIPGINERQAQILLEFFNEPNRIMTIEEVETQFLVVYQTARVDMLVLEKTGFLEKKKAGKKLLFFRAYKFEKVLDEYTKTENK
ncbi:MAG: Fic family protein [Candidatus Micrarchaeota archaeon]|nr:Fic family protein [Candidatus Micrarchaeota archaeon]